MKKKFYVTTAIVYANANPHIGYANEVIAADAIARYKRLSGFDTFFLTGSDEHSTNVYDKATEQGKDPQAYCDEMAGVYKDVWKKLDISNDDYIRTSEKRHVDVVQEMLRRMHKKGDIYKGNYEGWYCTSCEAFYVEGDLADGKCPVHKINPEWLKEENYFFRLSEYGDKLLDIINKNPDFIKPDIRRNEIVNIIKSGLRDISISRAGSSWGIPCPFDEQHVVYVWVDALINYVSGAGLLWNEKRFKKYWPADIHIIGKDITRFHCIIWPSMLMSAGIAIPGAIFGHGFLKIQGEKISKTRGNIVDPVALVDKFGPDGVRYYLLRHLPFDSDGDFSMQSMVSRFNSDLANDLGNLFHRTLSMCEKYFDGKIPPPGTEEAKDIALRSKVEEALKKLDASMKALKFNNALSSIWELVDGANKYIDETAPWKLAKSDRQRLATVMQNLAQVLRIVSILLGPFMPRGAANMWEQVGCKGKLEDMRIEDASWKENKKETLVGKGEVLFPRIEE
ncbi:MAG: methionine--tRNA ligase [bacterium]